MSLIRGTYQLMCFSETENPFYTNSKETEFKFSIQLESTLCIKWLMKQG